MEAQFGQWHGVQSYVGVSQRAGADLDHSSFRSQFHFDVADQCHRVHFAIHHQPCFNDGMEQCCSGGGRRQHEQRGDECRLRQTEVLPVKPVIKRINQ